MVTRRIGTKVCKTCSLLSFSNIACINFKTVIEENIHLCSGIQLNGNLYKNTIFREFQSRSQFRFKFQDRWIERNIDKRTTINLVTQIQEVRNQLTCKVHITDKLDFALTNEGSLHRSIIRIREINVRVHIEHQMASVILIGHNRFRSIPTSIAKGRQGIHINDLNIRMIARREIVQEKSRQTTIILHTDIQMGATPHLNVFQINIINFTRTSRRNVHISYSTVTNNNCFLISLRRINSRNTQIGLYTGDRVYNTRTRPGSIVLCSTFTDNQSSTCTGYTASDGLVHRSCNTRRSMELTAIIITSSKTSRCASRTRNKLGSVAQRDISSNKNGSAQYGIGVRSSHITGSRSDPSRLVGNFSRTHIDACRAP